MDKHPAGTSAAELRRKAEEMLVRQASSPPNGDMDTQRLLHEIQVHQIELEMQREELQASEQKYRLLAENAADCIFWIDPQGRFQYVSPATRQLSGYEPEDFIADPDLMLRLIHAEDRARYLEHLEQGEVADTVEMEFRIHHREGETRWVGHHCQPMYDDGGSYLGRRGSNRDITGRKRVEAVVEAASRAKTEFLATISHELRTPLNGVLGMAQLLQMTDLDGEQQEEVETVIGSAESLLAILNDILEFITAESGTPALVEATMQPRALLQTLQNGFASTAATKQIALRLAIADDVPETLALDGKRLDKLLTILVRNALAFTAQGEVVVAMTMGGEEKDAGHLCIQVSDTGIGMAPEVVAQLFQPFQQADGTSTRRHGGIGLGLALAKRIIDLMGGTISVKSQLGVGSRFVVSLPLR
jgi:PAS domain S-box-containing protein